MREYGIIRVRGKRREGRIYGVYGVFGRGEGSVQGNSIFADLQREREITKKKTKETKKESSKEKRK